MALFQYLGRRDQVNDNSGNPLSGGLVNLYAPNTLDRITSYSDSDLVAENTNPVVLSGSGRANIWINRNADVQITDKDGNLILEELAVNPDDLGGEFDSGLIQNGSFETDTDSDDVPDGWVNDVNDPGSNNGLDTTESTSGGQSWRTQSAGNGGGELVTENFFPVNDADDLRVNFDLRSTVAAVRNIVRVEWFDISQVSISNTDVYDSTANPLTFTSQNTLATPPSGARFAKIRIIGGETGGIIAGITYWDNFNVFYPQVVAGVFDNITIQNNSIVSTNTNGNIEITPNGTGSVIIGKNSTFNGEISANQESRFLASLDISLANSNAPIVVGSGTAQHLEIDPNDIQSKSNETTAATLGINTLGGDLNLGPQSGTGTTTLYHNGQQMLITAPEGVRILDGSGSAPQLSMESDGGTPLGRLESASNEFIMRNLVNGSPVSIRSPSAGGVSRLTFFADPDSLSSLYHAGVLKLNTDSTGLQIRADGNTDTEQNRFQLTHQDGTVRSFFGFSGSSALEFKNEINSGVLSFVTSNSGGADRNMVVGNPDTQVDIYDPLQNEIVIRTRDRTASDNAAGADVRGPDGTFRALGFNVAPENNQNASYVLARTDIGKIITHTSAPANTYTINQAVDIPAGALWVVINTAASVTLASGAGVTFRYFDGANWTDTTGNLSLLEGFLNIWKQSDSVYYIWGANFS